MLGAVVMAEAAATHSDEEVKPPPKRHSLITNFFMTKDGHEPKSLTLTSPESKASRKKTQPTPPKTSDHNKNIRLESKLSKKHKKKCKEEKVPEKEEPKQESLIPEGTVEIAYEDFLKSYEANDSENEEDKEGQGVQPLEAGEATTPEDQKNETEISCESADNLDDSKHYQAALEKENNECEMKDVQEKDENVEGENVEGQNVSDSQEEEAMNVDEESPQKDSPSKSTENECKNVKSSIEVQEVSTESEKKPAETKPKKKGIAMFFKKVDNKFLNTPREEKPVVLTIKADIHAPPSPAQIAEKTEPYKKRCSKKIKSNAVVESCDMDLGITHLETISLVPPVKIPPKQKKSETDKSSIKHATKDGGEKDEKKQEEMSEEEKVQKQEEEERKLAMKVVNAANMAKLDAVKVRASGSAKQATLSFTKSGLSTGKVLTTLQPLKSEDSEDENDEVKLIPTLTPAKKSKNQIGNFFLVSPRATTGKEKQSETEPKPGKKADKQKQAAEKTLKKVDNTNTSAEENPVEVKESTENVGKSTKKTTKKVGKSTGKSTKKVGKSPGKSTKKTPKKVKKPSKEKPEDGESGEGKGGEVESVSEEAGRTATDTASDGEDTGRYRLRARFRSSIVTTPKVTKRPPIKLKITRIASSDDDFLSADPKLNEKQRKAMCAQQILMKARSNKARKGKIAEPKIKKSKVVNKKKKVMKGETEGGEGPALRRSSRQTRTATTSNTDDSEEANETPKAQKKVAKEPKAKKTKPADGGGKKKAPAKLASIFTKKGNKSTEPILVDDDAEDDVSVIPVDPETLKIRRQFLMSGVPEALKRQSSVNVAINSSDYPAFPEVSHVMQVPEGAESETNWWNLKPVKLPLRAEGAGLDCEGAERKWDLEPTERISKTTIDVKNEDEPVIPADVVPYLVAEIHVSNPAFPVRRVYKQVQRMKTATDITPADDKQPTQDDKSTEEKGVSKKRKKSDDSDGAEQKTKRRRGSTSATPTEAEPERRRSSRRSARRSLPLEEAEQKEREKEEEEVIVVDITSPDASKKDEKTTEVKKEDTGPLRKDLMWTEKYEPTCSAEFLGNSSSVKKLKNWLIEWKHKTDLELKRARKQLLKEAKRAGKSKEDIKKEIRKKLGSGWLTDDESDFEIDEFESDESEEEEEEDDNRLCKATLLTGPHGVGKTALVNALARELGYKVFEVNASSRRSGKQILDQLQEATQSHQVSKANLDAKFTAQMAAQALTSQPEAQKKMPTAFAKFFTKNKPGEGQSGAETGNTKQGKKESTKKESAKKESAKKEPAKKSTLKESLKSSEEKKEATVDSGAPKGLNLSSTSLVLFEEADVIFEDDKGFWAAVQTFMSTTKRPIILTSSTSKSAIQLEHRYEHLHLKQIPAMNIASHLQLISLAENVRTSFPDILSLVEFCHNDLRRSLLTLQYWLLSLTPRSPTLSLPIQHSPKFFTSKAKDSENLALTPGPKFPIGSPMRFASSRDSGSDFESSPIVKRKRRCARVLIEDESSLDSMSQSPRKRPFMTGVIDEDSRGFDGLPVVGGCMEELVTPDVTYTPPVHVGLLHSVITCGLPGQTLLQYIQECVSSSSLHSTHHLSTFLSLGHSLLYMNQSSLLGLPTSAPIRRPSSTILHQQKPQHSRIKTINDFSSSDDSSDGFVSLKKNKTSEKPEPKPEELEIEDPMGERLLHGAVCRLSELYDTMSFIDSYMNPQNEDIEGECRGGAGWGRGRLTPGLTDTGPRWTRHDPHHGRLTTEAATSIHVLGVARTRAGLGRCVEAVDGLKIDGQDKVKDRLSLPQEKSGLSLHEHFTLYRTLKDRHERAVEYVSSVLPPSVQLCKQAVTMDYMPTVRTICRAEQLRQVTNTKRRFLHYMDYISLPVSKKASVLDTLCSSYT